VRVAILSDAHANLDALQAVFADITQQKIERTVFLGDAVGYGSEPNACVELVAKVCDTTLLGNHDSAALGWESPTNFNELARSSILWTRDALTANCRATLAGFGMQDKLENIFLTHASPRAPHLWEYVLTIDDATEQFEHFDEPVMFIGHSHIPAVFRQDEDGVVSHRVVTEARFDDGRRYIVNVGSIGQPRDQDPRACYVTFDTDTRLLRYHRVAYDVSRAQERIAMAGLPRALAERLAVGR